MRIISIHCYLCNEETIQLGAAFDLSFASIFQKGTIKEFINFHSRLVVRYIIIYIIIF